MLESESTIREYRQSMLECLASFQQGKLPLHTLVAALEVFLPFAEEEAHPHLDRLRSLWEDLEQENAFTFLASPERPAPPRMALLAPVLQELGQLLAWQPERGSDAPLGCGGGP